MSECTVFGAEQSSSRWQGRHVFPFATFGINVTKNQIPNAEGENVGYEHSGILLMKFALLTDDRKPDLTTFNVCFGFDMPLTTELANIAHEALLPAFG